MKFLYKFSNLLGTVYRKGNLLFTPDGNSVISPVGNRISIFDLKNNKSRTLSVESRLNLTTLALAPDGNLLIAVNEEGEALLISVSSGAVLHQFHFHRPIHAVSFSPDGSKFAVTKENSVLLYQTPGRGRQMNPFVLLRTFYGAYDETTSIDWTSDSRAFCVGGKDMNTRVYAAQRLANLVIYSLGGHTDLIVNAFFEKDSLDVLSVSANGQLCVWECDTDLSSLIPASDSSKRQDSKPGDEEDGADDAEAGDDVLPSDAAAKPKTQISYRRLAKHNLKAARPDGASPAKTTTAAYHKHLHILITGFDDGTFLLHEMPDFNLIHSLSVSDQSISSVVFNGPGDWLALGCTGLGQLLVWEWQSETYVLKQQGHYHNMSCLSHSPDGQYIVTGGDDGKVKVWNMSSGFCFVTFTEHTAGITGVTFTQNGQVIISASLDGTVRAFDLNRYRNFRTFTSPRPVQFSSVAVDESGELVCAGGQDVFEIFVWSMQTGRLLEVLSGHEAPVSCVVFSPGRAMLASASWDATVRLWDVFDSKATKEVYTVGCDALALAFRPDGRQLAVALISGRIVFWDVQLSVQVAAIEGQHDLGYTRKDQDKITAKKSSSSKCFTSLCYTADGSCVLAGGRSKNICIYSVADQILVKKFEVSCNLSFDGMQEFLDRRKMTEWGSLALVDEGQGDDDKGKAIGLPGVAKGNSSLRHFKPEVRVFGVQFSPTGRSWSAVSTEGLLVFSLDHSVLFDPYDLDLEVNPQNIRKALQEGDYRTALVMACRLNENRLLEEVCEMVPPSDIELLVRSLPDVFVDRLLSHVGGRVSESCHLEYYLRWTHHLLYSHGPRLKQRSASIMASLRTLQSALTQTLDRLGKLCDHNKYTLQHVLTVAGLYKKRKMLTDVEEGSDLEGDSEGEGGQLWADDSDADPSVMDMV